MVEFKVVVSDPKTGRAWNVTITGKNAERLIGNKIGDNIDGTILGLPGYQLEITGGSDYIGVPMRKDAPGPRRIRVLLTKGVGFRGKKGERRRKLIRGNTISEEIVQINMKITKYGKKSLDELLGKEEGEKK